MGLTGAEGMTVNQLEAEVLKGGRFVLFDYCISIIIMTFRRSSDVHFVRAGQGTFMASLPYTLLTLVMGWWGFPFGPIFSIWALFTNLTGGKDVTSEVMARLQGRPAAANR